MNHGLAFNGNTRHQVINREESSDYLESAQTNKKIRLGGAFVNVGLNDCGVVFVMIDTGMGAGVSLTERIN